MAEKIYTLAEETIRKLKADHLRLMAMYRNLETQLRRYKNEGHFATRYIGRIRDDDIEAMSDQTPGIGRVEVFKFDPEAGDGEYVSAGWYIESVKNLGNAIAAEDAWCQVSRDMYGTWALDVVFCDE